MEKDMERDGAKIKPHISGQSEFFFFLWLNK